MGEVATEAAGAEEVAGAGEAKEAGETGEVARGRVEDSFLLLPQALRTHGAGVSSVRFICGTQDIHKQLEAKIAKVSVNTAKTAWPCPKDCRRLDILDFLNKFIILSAVQCSSVQLDFIHGWI